MTSPESIRRLIDRVNLHQPFHSSELFGPENLFLAVASANASATNQLRSELNAAITTLISQIETPPPRWNRDADAGIPWDRLPDEDRELERDRHRALLLAHVHFITVASPNGPGLDSSTAQAAADCFTRAWSAHDVFPAPHLQGRRGEQLASHSLYASFRAAFGDQWSSGVWTVWDLVRALRRDASRVSEYDSRVDALVETRLASTPVLLYNQTTRNAEVARLWVQLELGERGGFWPSPLGLGATHIRRIHNGPDGSQLDIEPAPLDFLASMRRAWQASGLADLPVRGCWWIATYESGWVDVGGAATPFSLPFLEGRSCEAAACCTLWAAYGGRPGHGALSPHALRLDDERPITATIGVRDSQGRYQLGPVAQVPRKSNKAKQRGLAGPVLVSEQVPAGPSPTLVVANANPNQASDPYLRLCRTLDTAFEGLLAMSNLRDAHSRHIASVWNENWANTPFIDTQKLKLLTDLDTPQNHLRTEAFKSRRDVQGDGPKQADDPWRDLQRRELVAGRAKIDDVEHPLRRLFITSDAGMGKSTTVEWLEWEWNQSDRETLAIRLRVKDLELLDSRPLIPEADDDDQSVGLLVERAAVDCEVASMRTSGEAAAWLRRLRDQGRLVLLFDGLDEVTPDSPSITALAEMTQPNTVWRHCRIVVAGRPYAITTMWDHIFENERAAGWRFVLIDEFTPEEQERYLGTELYRRVPEDAREILTVPRVLYYLRRYVQDPRRIQSASHVYWTAVRRIISDGLDAGAQGGGRAAGTVNLQTHVKLELSDALLLLAAFGFELAVVRGEFNAVACDDALVIAVASACQTHLSSLTPKGRVDVTQGRDWVQWVKERLPLLAATNGPFKHDLIEHGCPETIQFRNRSLQEFFAAYWMSNYCLEDQVDVLKTRLPLAHDSAGQAWYWVFRFAAEMPSGALDAPHVSARADKQWARAMSAVFCRGDGTAVGTKRASELIVRAWPTLITLSKHCPPARQLLKDWRAEFQAILSSGNEWARELVSSFVPIDGGTLKMGSPKSDEERFSDEPEELEIPIEPFSLCRFPMLNGFYQLYDPGHGGAERKYLYGEYSRVSPSERHPAVYISWWDARAASLWFYWQDEHGRLIETTLPNEAEHEWVAKDGSSIYQPYWWGTEFPSPHCHSAAGSTAELPRWTPEITHPRMTRRWGIFDIVGSVRQWSINVWQDQILSQNDVCCMKGGPHRAFRGGSWWFSDARYFRSACRFDDGPGYRDDYLGFRLAVVRPC